MTDHPGDEHGSTDEPMVDVGSITSQENGHEIKSDRRGFFELIYGVLFNPVEAFRSIANEPPVFHGFVIFISVLVINSLVNMLLPQDLGEVPPELAEVVSQVGPAIVIIGAILSTVFWLIQAGVFQVIAELLGGRGRAVGVLTVLALAAIPSVLMVPFTVLSYILPKSFTGSFLTIAGSLLVFVWWAVLLVIGLREIHRFSTLKAIATVIAPLIGMGLILIVTVISLFALIAPLFNNIQ